MSNTDQADVLFVRNDGLWGIASVTGGKLVLSQSGHDAAPNWTHVVAVGNEILFVRDDGLYAVANIADGKLHLTQSGEGAATDWTHVVAVGSEVLFVRNDGLWGVASVTGGKLVLSQSGHDAAPNWTHVVAVGNEILFVRDDGLYAVANIADGKLHLTQSGEGAATDWTHVVAVGSEVLFVRNDGLWGVASVTGGKLVLSQSGHDAAPNWTHVVAVGNEILFVRDDGLYAVANIADGKLHLTQSGEGAATDWTHVVAVGSEVLFVRDDGLWGVASVTGGKLVLSQSGHDAAPNWTHIVAVGGPRTTALAREVAQQRVEETWSELGGPSSYLGLPVLDKITLARVDGGFRADFRSGQIAIRDNGTIEPVPGDWCRIHWVGIECVQRQEGQDELYGVVWCDAPGRGGGVRTVQFPGGSGTYSMGETGTRLISSWSELYYGPLVNVSIGVNLIENDSGDVKGISEDITNAIVQGGAALLSGATGASAEAIANNTWYKRGIGVVAGLLLDDLLGIGDDPYNPASQFVTWQEIASPPAPKSYQRPGEGPTIKAYNYTVSASGRDDGGDVGEYRLFFLFEHANNPGPEG